MPVPAPSPSSTSEGEQLWGRAAGGSAATRAAALERERANWAAGGDGERLVGAELDQLPAGRWWVFHDLPRGTSGTNVDHLVIGVGGVFAVNTKNVAGNVWVAERALLVDGEKTNYLPVAASEAADVTRRLTRRTPWRGSARPLLVFTSSPTVKTMPTDVTVLHLGNVRGWLLQQPSLLTPQQAYEIVLAANDATTWR